jgi:serine phosphatase RsbU (regulator of sigma subunit)
MIKNTVKDSILYVDDEEDNLIVFEATFHRHYTIYTAQSAQEGIELLSLHPIQLIITDQRMPGMTGIEFLEKIIPIYPDITRIILTGFSDLDDIIQAINVGKVYQYIQKPWNKDDFKIKIDNALESYSLKVENKKLISNLQETNRTLEQRVEERTAEVIRQKQAITDSIIYAFQIQSSLLPPVEVLTDCLLEHFIFFKPRDIVSGDFYWFKRINNLVCIVAADCTGHGVPGALMSMLGISLLNEIVGSREIFSAADILNELRKRVKKSLHQANHDSASKDGMDMAFCILNLETKHLQYSGAYNSLIVLKHADQSLVEIKGDRMTVGTHPKDNHDFTNLSVQLEKNDTIYMFSDGYTSQFGGLNGDKFNIARFRELLKSFHNRSIAEQRELLEKTLVSWQGHHDQVDDILVVGIQV